MSKEKYIPKPGDQFTVWEFGGKGRPALGVIHTCVEDHKMDEIQPGMVCGTFNTGDGEQGAFYTPGAHIFVQVKA